MVLKRHGLVRRRRAMGFTQESLAEALNIDRSTVVRWEAGRNDPQAWVLPRLASTLQVSAEALSELLSASTAETARQGERLEYALRYPSRIDLVTVAELRAAAQSLADHYERMPSATLLADAGQQLGRISFLASEAPAGQIQRELCIFQADAARFMGQLVWDASQRRDHQTAQAYYQQSAEVARHLRDQTAEGHALLRTCYVALYGASDHRRGLELALEAAYTTRYSSHIITGIAMLHAAEAHAFLGDAAECERALLGAEKHLEQASTSDAVHGLLTPTHFGRLAGSCYLSLGDFHRARRYLQDTATELRDRRKSRAIVLGNLTLACLRDADLDAALVAFGETVEELRGTRGGGGMNIAFRAARELRPWRDEPAVMEAQDRLMSLMEAA